MKRNLEGFRNKYYDLIVIGGGISGAALALDAVLRGLSVALLDKGDFGSETSSASSKIIHGGIRFLQQGKIFKVRESALERSFFQILAPHLTYFVPFIIPTEKSLIKGKNVLRMALFFYELLCTGENENIKDPGKKIPRSELLNKSDIFLKIPALKSDEITGGISFHECHMHSSERMTLAFIESAYRHGADVGNYLKVTSFHENQRRVEGVLAKDLIGGEELTIKGSMVANCGGPWINEINGTLKKHTAENPIKGLSKGMHLVTKQLFKKYALAFVTKHKSQAKLTRGGRHIFVIPWRNYSLIGTTYSPYQSGADEVSITESEINEFIEDINDSVPGISLKREDVNHAFAGLYPIMEGEVKGEIYQGMTDYKIIDHLKTDNLNGLVSVFCAKYTTARKLAEQATNLIVKKLGKKPMPCLTSNYPLVGGDIQSLNEYIDEKKLEYGAVIDGDTTAHLIRNYGTQMDKVVSLIKEDPCLSKRLTEKQEVTEAEIVYATREEMAMRLPDIIFRRTGLGTVGNPGKEAIRRCAEIMASIHGWDESTIENEIKQTEDMFFAHHHRISTPGLG